LVRGDVDAYIRRLDSVRLGASRRGTGMAPPSISGNDE